MLVALRGFGRRSRSDSIRTRSIHRCVLVLSLPCPGVGTLECETGPSKSLTSRPIPPQPPLLNRPFSKVKNLGAKEIEIYPCYYYESSLTMFPIYYSIHTPRTESRATFHLRVTDPLSSWSTRHTSHPGQCNILYHFPRGFVTISVSVTLLWAFSPEIGPRRARDHFCDVPRQSPSSKTNGYAHPCLWGSRQRAGWIWH